MFHNLFFFDDVVELWIKFNQRGIKFILSKLTFLNQKRTVSSFSAQFEHANWWIIPYLNERVNFLISGNSKIQYEQYISEKYFDSEKPGTLISLGCGAGNHEMNLARLNPHQTIIGYDISKELIDRANEKADQLANISFYDTDVYKLDLEAESVDCFLFNASLHHFKDIKTFIRSKIYPALKKDGLVVINEYVGPNRLNFSKAQIDYCNKCLNDIVSKENRKILHLNSYKTRCYRLGKIRMIVSDPSECVDSASILPVLRGEFEELEFKNLGGNILLPVLKHIAHHFVNNNKQELIELIKKEDAYLTDHASDFAFAVYQKR